MRFLYQYQCVNFNKNIDCEKIQYRKTKNEYRRSGKFFFGNKGHYKICGLEEINQVRVSVSKSSIFMYLNSLEKLSDEEVLEKFKAKRIEIEGILRYDYSIRWILNNRNGLI